MAWPWYHVKYFFVNLQSFESHDFALVRVKIHRDFVVVVEKNFPIYRLENEKWTKEVHLDQGSPGSMQALEKIRSAVKLESLGDWCFLIKI